MIMWIAASLVLALIVAWIALEPLIAGEASNSGALGLGEPSARDDATERAFRSLKDLEFDFKMGKLSAVDYADAKERLSGEVALLLNEER